MKETKEGIDRYLQDESNSKSVNVEEVCVPEGAADLSFFLKHTKKQFTVFGGGTGIAGGATARGGIIVSTEKFNRIKINQKEKTAEAGAGVKLFELHAELEKYGLWYPVDSTEQTSSIGGNAATNAWGTRSYKYGSIRNFITELGVVTAAGDYLEIKRGGLKADGLIFNAEGNVFEIMDLSDKEGVKNSAGYYMRKNMDLIDLFIGCEGTLGIISDLKLRLLDTPLDIHAFMLPFLERGKAFDFVKRLKEHIRLKPLSLEFMDENSVELLRDKFAFPAGRICLVFTEFEEKSEIMDEFLEFVESEGIDTDRVKTESALKKQGFIYDAREALPQTVNEIIRHNKTLKISTDFSVTDENFSELVKEYYNALGKTVVKHVVFGHAGNNNLHINFMPENRPQQEEAVLIYDLLAKKAAAMGGSVSAEHGIGKHKKKYLKYMYNEEQINAMREVKKYFDPDNLSCPGNIFD
jgi:D-lactate dehydrogenase (cytochrome)